jgi:NADH-quinone oxidoreductase subunit N
VTGSTRLARRIGAYLAAQAMTENPLVLVAIGLLLVGFAFKISAVPFHMWTPDAYEGAPAVVTGFMSTGVKAAAFAAFARVFLSAFEPFTPTGCRSSPPWLCDDGPRDGRRGGAEQPEAHARVLEHRARRVPAGGLVAANEVGKAAMLFYLLAYAVTNLAAFGVIALLGSRERERTTTLRDYAGLWHTHPALAALMTVSLLSLGGLPPTAGFIAKWYVFSAAVSAGYYGLAIIGVLTSVVSVFFYLRVVVMMYMSERDAGPRCRRRR